MIVRCRTAVLLALVCALPALAEKFWESKEFTEWTEKECVEMLRKSPWAYSNTFGRVQSVMIGGNSEAPEGGSGAQAGNTQPKWGEAESADVIEIQFLTARPIRMAMARLQMLRKPEDAGLREQALRYVNQELAKLIVIQIGYRTIPPGSQAVSDIHSFFFKATLADFRTDTKLITDKNRTISIAEYWAPDRNRSNPAFVFSRFDDRGQPHFTGSEKSITLRSRFTPELRGRKQTYDIFVKMNPRQMWFRNEFAF